MSMCQNEVVQNSSNSWMSKHPCAWNNADCLRWFRSVSEDNNWNFSQIDLKDLRFVNGSSLVQMGVMDFISRDPVHGVLWYNAIRKILNERKNCDIRNFTYEIVTHD